MLPHYLKSVESSWWLVGISSQSAYVLPAAWIFTKERILFQPIELTPNMCFKSVWRNLCFQSCTLPLGNSCLRACCPKSPL